MKTYNNLQVIEDEKYMRRAIKLALNGKGFAHPNPLVGAVIVKDGKIIGEGAHLKYGMLHAERNAIKSATIPVEGATLYVTLEPCCHYGKTPPCTETIIENKIKRVVIGSRDPNPKVLGRGVKIMRDAGIEVVTDFLRTECDSLNSIFFHYIKEHTPYVLMKYAMTIDGKIATTSGKSKWITNDSSRELVHEIRHEYMGIMVGIGTVLSDDPTLNCRSINIDEVRQPIRIICDSHLRIPMESKIVKTAYEYETMVIISDKNLPFGDISTDIKELDKSLKRDKILSLLNSNVRIVNIFAEVDDRIDLSLLMNYLGENKIDSILLEGGGTLNESALRAGIVNEVMAIIAPKVFGGFGKSPVMGDGVDDPDKAYRLRLKSIKNIDEDIVLNYIVDKR